MLEKQSNQGHITTQDEEVIHQTAKQIMKDFAMFDEEVFPEGDGTPYERLFRGVAPQVSKLLHKDFNKLISLLYRIDVAERKLNTAINIRAGDDIASVITDLIIERELEKVLLRRSFS